VEGNNTAVVSVKVPKRIKEKMRSIDVRWSEVLRKAIEIKIKEHERKQAVANFLEFRTKSKVPKNKTSYTSEVLVRETREER
jgi:hypothetical protein